MKEWKDLKEEIRECKISTENLFNRFDELSDISSPEILKYKLAVLSAIDLYEFLLYDEHDKQTDFEQKKKLLASVTDLLTKAETALNKI